MLLTYSKHHCGYVRQATKAKCVPPIGERKSECVLPQTMWPCSVREIPVHTLAQTSGSIDTFPIRNFMFFFFISESF